MTNTLTIHIHKIETDEEKIGMDILEEIINREEKITIATNEKLFDKLQENREYDKRIKSLLQRGNVEIALCGYRTLTDPCISNRKVILIGMRERLEAYVGEKIKVYCPPDGVYTAEGIADLEGTRFSHLMYPNTQVLPPRKEGRNMVIIAQNVFTGENKRSEHQYLDISEVRSVERTGKITTFLARNQTSFLSEVHDERSMWTKIRYAWRTACSIPQNPHKTMQVVPAQSPQIPQYQH